GVTLFGEIDGQRRGLETKGARAVAEGCLWFVRCELLEAAILEIGGGGGRDGDDRVVDVREWIPRVGIRIRQIVVIFGQPLGEREEAEVFWIVNFGAGHDRVVAGPGVQADSDFGLGIYIGGVGSRMPERYLPTAHLPAGTFGEDVATPGA